MTFAEDSVFLCVPIPTAPLLLHVVWVPHHGAVTWPELIQVLPMSEIRSRDGNMIQTRSQCGVSGIETITGHVGFLSCHNILPQTGWFKTIGAHSLGAWNPKSRCQQGHDPFEVSGEESFHDPSWFVVVAGTPWCSLACRHITLTSALVVTWLSSLCLCPVSSHGVLCISSTLFIGHQSYWVKSPPYSSMASS